MFRQYIVYRIDCLLLLFLYIFFIIYGKYATHSVPKFQQAMDGRRSPAFAGRQKPFNLMRIDSLN